MDRLLREWGEIWRGPKSIVGWANDWQEIKVARLTQAQATKKGTKPFRSSDAQQLEIVNLIGDANCVSIEGLRLRIQAWRERPLTDVTATLELVRGYESVCLARVDMRPTSPHVNVHWRRFKLVHEIEGSHVHPFDMNAKLGRDAFAPAGNLPVAVPLDPEPESFAEFVAMVEALFKIDGTAQLRGPDWNGRLPI